MAAITFKTKLIPLLDDNGKEIDKLLKVPELSHNHCDMVAFRQHPKFGIFANSDLFPNALARIRCDILGRRQFLKLSDLPPNITVNASGFLAVVTVDV